MFVSPACNDGSLTSDFFVLELSCSPFYGEDFYCEIPRSFRHLSFYIFDRDVFRRDSSIGKNIAAAVCSNLTLGKGERTGQLSTLKNQQER